MYVFEGEGGLDKHIFQTSRGEKELVSFVRGGIPGLKTITRTKGSWDSAVRETGKGGGGIVLTLVPTQTQCPS